VGTFSRRWDAEIFLRANFGGNAGKPDLWEKAAQHQRVRTFTPSRPVRRPFAVIER